MIVFTLFVLVLMLVVAGMAVDFMRFESRRSIMQGAVDRAVLAAADLDQLRDADEVVRDYIEKSQGGNCLATDPVVTNGANFKSVSANCALTMDTFFLRLIGMETLTAAASATAIEGVTNVEVSLVVDISGSMGTIISGSDRRIDRLEEASLAFIDTLLIEEHEDKISLSLIPYSAHVNAGKELFDAVGATRQHYYSNCVDIPDGELGKAEWSSSVTYGQGQHYQYWSNPIDTPVCPMYSYEEIIPISQNKSDFEDAIKLLEPRGTTSIFLGIKWGAALLDPSFQDVFANIPSSKRDSAFDGRPFEHDADAEVGGTKKYIVVMTDGQNYQTDVLQDWAYDSPSEIEHWSHTSYKDFKSYELENYDRYDGYTYQKYSSADGDDYMEEICTAAKEKGIVIFAVAMGSTDHGEEQMSKCASSPSHYFETSGDELVAIFEAIADQITDLRLTL